MSTARQILVVDDEETNRSLVRAYLSPPYEVIEAVDAAQALAFAASRSFDLVLLDVQMPGMNGFDACRALKAKHGPGGFLPVLLLTALNLPEDRIEGFASGADDFLSKPLDRRELLLRVRAFLRLREQDESLRAQQATIRKQLDELGDLQLLKDDLFSLLVHDLRNPLAGIVGFLGLLQDELAGPELAKARTYADRAAQSTIKLRALLEDVLQVQELEASGFPLARVAIEVSKVVLDAAATLEGAGRARRVTIDVAIESDRTLSLDPALTRRAVENLVANALKFAPTSSAVSVGLRSLPGRVVIEVADRGPGVTDAKKIQLFKKFAGVEPSKPGERARGFGLGLHLVKLVANAHGGEANVRDRPGGGAIFALSFPDPTG